MYFVLESRILALSANQANTNQDRQGLEQKLLEAEQAKTDAENQAKEKYEKSVSINK